MLWPNRAEGQERKLARVIKQPPPGDLRRAGRLRGPLHALLLPLQVRPQGDRSPHVPPLRAVLMLRRL